jgi:hypothetical protein
MKKNKGMLFLLTALMFVSLPVSCMISLSNGRNSASSGSSSEEALSNHFASLLNMLLPLTTVPLVLLFALILCVTLFGYMQKKRSVDLFHSLPVGRAPLLLGRWCTGLTVLFAPLLICFVALGIIAQAYGIAGTFAGLAPKFLWVLLMGTAAFTFSMLMAVCSGTIFDTMISIVGVNIGYPLFILCIFSYIQGILPGAHIDWGDSLTVVTLLAPFAAPFLPFMESDMTTSPLYPTFYLVWWILLTVLMLVGSVRLYQRRKSESAEDTFAFRIPKTVIRFLITAVGGFGLGLLMDSNGGILFYLGVFIGSVLAHVVVEALYSRGFRNMKKSMAWYGMYAAFFVVFYGILATGFFGYDTRVPNTDEVASVAVQTGYDSKVSGPGCQRVCSQNGQPIAQIEPVFTKPADIQKVISVHKDIVDLYREEGYPYRPKGYCGFGTTLTYHLKNGRTFQRMYTCYDLQARPDYILEMENIIKKISDLPDYKSGRDAIFYVDPKDIASMTFQLPADEKTGQATAITDETEKEELFSALKQDFSENKINYSSDEEHNLLVTFTLTFQDQIPVKDSRLKILVGGYKGKISLPDSSYSIYDTNSSAYRVLQKWEGMEQAR